MEQEGSNEATIQARNGNLLRGSIARKLSSSDGTESEDSVSKDSVASSDSRRKGLKLSEDSVSEDSVSEDSVASSDSMRK